MIKYLLKGILRDKNRSLLPIIIITIGVFLTITLSGFMRGMMGDMIDQNARYDTGHMKIMTREYAENKDQLPNDLCLLGVDKTIDSLKIALIICDPSISSSVVINLGVSISSSTEDNF